MSREDVEKRFADAEADLVMFLAAVEHGDSRLAADILMSIGVVEPAAFVSFNRLAAELLKTQRRVRELEAEQRT